MRMCKGKKRRDEANARSTVRDLELATGRKFNAYLCHHCGFWHVGHDRVGGRNVKIEGVRRIKRRNDRNRRDGIAAQRRIARERT